MLLSIENKFFLSNVNDSLGIIIIIIINISNIIVFFGYNNCNRKFYILIYRQCDMNPGAR